MLRYPKGQPPKVLIPWQATPGADWESLPSADKEEVRQALLRDQGQLCAYCQRRIPTRAGHMKVEHWQAQSGGQDKLRWSNLLGVCLGDERAETGAPAGEQHCDTARGDAPLFLHPVEGGGGNTRAHLAYTFTGEVTPKDTTRRDSVRKDIAALNLNAARLRRERREIYDALWVRLEQANFHQKALRDELAAAQIEPGSRATAQCEMVRYLVERWARKQNLTL